MSNWTLKTGLLHAAFGPSQSISSADHWIIRAIQGGPTKAGVPVSHYNAITMPAVWACISLIADTMAQLPVDVFQKVGDKREERPDHPASQLLKAVGNADMGPKIVIGTAQTHVGGWGNGYLHIERNSHDQPKELWPLLPDRTVADIRAIEGRRVLRYLTTVDGRQEPVKAKDVIHIRGYTHDGINGMSPITYARNAIGMGLAMEEYGSKFFANDAKSGGFLQYPGQLKPSARKNIQDSIMPEGEGLTEAHRPKILEEGMKYVPNTVSQEDSQFLESREFQIAEIARMYRVPLVLINSHQKDTAWGTGIEQLMIGFVTWTMAPWVMRWEEELNRKLLTEDDRKKGFYIKFNLNGLMRGDMKTRADYYQKAFGRWMDADDIRPLEELNPKEVKGNAQQSEPVPAAPGDQPGDPGD